MAALAWTCKQNDKNKLKQDGQVLPPPEKNSNDVPPCFVKEKVNT